MIEMDYKEKCSCCHQAMMGNDNLMVGYGPQRYAMHIKCGTLDDYKNFFEAYDINPDMVYNNNWNPLISKMIHENGMIINAFPKITKNFELINSDIRDKVKEYYEILKNNRLASILHFKVRPQGFTPISEL